MQIVGALCCIRGQKIRVELDALACLNCDLAMHYRCIGVPTGYREPLSTIAQNASACPSCATDLLKQKGECEREREANVAEGERRRVIRLRWKRAEKLLVGVLVIVFILMVGVLVLPWVALFLYSITSCVERPPWQHGNGE